MTASRFFFLFFWVAPHVFQIPIIVIMVRRKMVREFPIFFVYTCFQILQTAVLFTIDQSDRFTGDQYIVCWLAEEYVSVVLRFGVIHEIFQHVFRNYPALQRLGGSLVRWSTVVLMIAAVILVSYSTGTNLDRVTLVLVVVNRAVNIMQVGLLVLLLLLVRYLHLSWSTYVLPMALGLGLYASAMLVNTALQAHFGAFVNLTLTRTIEVSAYGCCVLVWLTGLLLPQPAAKQIETPVIHELEDWNAALQRLLQQ
ncbi:MAG TPA: hypothetical protein VFA40_25415 [Terriglobales bacterium]|nr:hypothetical protein [Terriglobales bacterium]